MQHLGGDDLSALNNDQRIILASHRFAPEVTSAALWLNDKAHGEDLITCVTLTPYRDAAPARCTSRQQQSYPCREKRTTSSA